MALKNSQYDELMRSYSRIQLNNAHKLNRRYQEVYNRLPDLTDYDERLASLRSDKLMATLEDTDTTEVDAKIDELSKKRNELIESRFGVGYLDPIYTCPACKDTGFVDNRHCTCFTKAAIDLLYESSNNKNIDRSHTFKNFNYNVYSNVPDESGCDPRSFNTKVVEAAKELVDNIENKATNIFLFGAAGIGKTYICDCIFNELISTLHPTIYLTATDFYDDIANRRFNKDYDSEEPVDDPLLSCDLLILDDLGSEKVTEFTRAMLFHYIDKRYRLGKSTVISSNYDIDQVRAIYEERISSRIKGYYSCFEMMGTDLRTK